MNQKSAKFSGGGCVVRANEPAAPCPGAVSGTDLARAAPRPARAESFCTDRETGETLMVVGRDTRVAPAGRPIAPARPRTRRRGRGPIDAAVVKSLWEEYARGESVWAYSKRRAAAMGVATQTVYFIMINQTYKDPAWVGALAKETA